jgi:hypothetical protein
MAAIVAHGRPPVGSGDVAAGHSLPAAPPRRSRLRLGRGEWPRGHEPMRCYPRASLSVARGSACRGMQTSVTVQHPRTSGIALEKCATPAARVGPMAALSELRTIRSWSGLPCRGEEQLDIGLAEVVCLVPEARGATVAARDPSPDQRRGPSCPEAAAVSGCSAVNLVAASRASRQRESRAYRRRRTSFAGPLLTVFLRGGRPGHRVAVLLARSTVCGRCGGRLLLA